MQQKSSSHNKSSMQPNGAFDTFEKSVSKPRLNVSITINPDCDKHHQSSPNMIVSPSLSQSLPNAVVLPGFSQKPFSQKCSALLTRHGLFIPESALIATYKSVAPLYARLTATYRPRVGPPKKIIMYERVQRPSGQILIRLPRGFIGELTARGVEVANKLVAVPCIPPPILCELYPNQLIILDHLMKEIITAPRIAAGTAIAILNLRAGMGKTFVAAGLIERCQMRTLYIVPSIVLAEQAYKDFKGCFEAGVYWKTRTRSQQGDVTIMVINTALKQDDTFFAQFGLVIYDEVHMYCTDKRAAIFRRECPIKIGMSATTDQRRDTFDIIAHMEVTIGGNHIYSPAVIYAEKIPGFTYDDVTFKTLVTAIKYKGPPEYTRTLEHPSTERMFTPWMHEQFLRDPTRTAIVVAAIRELYDWRDGDKQHRIFVFCEEREPLGHLYQLLRQTFEIIAPELDKSNADALDLLAHDTGQFIGGIKTAEIARCKKDARILLTTYGYSSTGVSISEMTAAVFWTSRRSNMLQILSRIMRRSGDQSIRRRVIDIIDDATPMRSQYYERRNAYTYFGMEIETRKVCCGQLAAS